MKTANLRAGSQAARRRRTIGGSAGIEITLPKLKDETNFMSTQVELSHVQVPREFCQTRILKSISFKQPNTD